MDIADASRRFACGIRTFSVSESSLDEAVRVLADGVDPRGRRLSAGLLRARVRRRRPCRRPRAPPARRRHRRLLDGRRDFVRRPLRRRPRRHRLPARGFRRRLHAHPRRRAAFGRPRIGDGRAAQGGAHPAAAGREAGPDLRGQPHRRPVHARGGGRLGDRLGARRHSAGRRLGRRRHGLPRHDADPRRHRPRQCRHPDPGVDRQPLPRLQERQFRADRPQARRHRVGSGPAHRARTQCRDRRLRIRDRWSASTRTA